MGSDPTNTTSPFFRLPRELRDKIYADLGREDLSLGEICECVLRGYIRPSLLLVSRQFGAEYKAEIERNLTLFVHPIMDLERFRQALVAQPQYRHALSKVRQVLFRCYPPTNLDRRTSYQIERHNFRDIVARADRYQGHLPRHYHALEACKSALPSVRELEIILVMPTLQIFQTSDPMLGRFDLAISQFFAEPIDFPCKVTRAVDIRSGLWSFPRPMDKAEKDSYVAYLRDQVDKGDVRGLYNHEVRFRATPSDGPYSFRGLAMDVVDVGAGWEDYIAFCQGYIRADQE